MPERKSYGQFCGLARAMDRIGDRWTLLIVRELLLGPKAFRELKEGLCGVSSAVLTRRIVDLVSDGLVVRSSAPKRSKAVAYGLTNAGRQLEPVVLELIKWGSRWMVAGPGTDRVDPTWSPLALRALLADQPTTVDGVVHLDVSGCEVTIESRHGRRSVLPGRHGRAHATVAIELPAALAVAAGETRLADTKARIAGHARIAAGLLQPRPDHRRARRREPKGASHNR